MQLSQNSLLLSAARQAVHCRALWWTSLEWLETAFIEGTWSQIGANLEQLSIQCHACTRSIMFASKNSRATGCCMYRQFQLPRLNDGNCILFLLWQQPLGANLISCGGLSSSNVCYTFSWPDLFNFWKEKTLDNTVEETHNFRNKNLQFKWTVKLKL